MTIDVSRAHFWDISGVGALDKIIARLRRDGSEVNVIGYNEASADIVDRFAMHDKTGFELGQYRIDLLALPNTVGDIAPTAMSRINGWRRHRFQNQLRAVQS